MYVIDSGFRERKLIHEWIKLKSTQTTIIRKKFRQGIGIAETSQEIRRNCLGGNENHKFLFDSVTL